MAVTVAYEILSVFLGNSDTKAQRMDMIEKAGMHSHAGAWEPGKNQHQKSVNQEMKDAEKSMIFITPDQH
jgi:hypothetical protein